MKTSIGAISFAAMLAIATNTAHAKPADCFSTDDGYFDCDFILTDPDGSFEVRGADVTHILVMDRPGRAYGFINLGNRNVSLPGTFVRETADRACWRNDETGARLCAW